MGADKTEKFSMDSIILADDSFAYTLVHSKDSPFRLQPKSRSLVSVKEKFLGISSKSNSRKEIAFMDDPRIIIIPLYINPKILLKLLIWKSFLLRQTHISFRKLLWLTRRN